MKKCLEEGILQGYLDGELSPEMMKEAGAHVAACAACAEELRQAESELAMFTAAFAADASPDVPSERLRERIDAAIAGLQAPTENITRKGSGRSLQSLLAPLAALFTFTPQRAAAFASIAAVVAFAAIMAVVLLRPSDQEVAVKKTTPPVIATATPQPVESPEKTGPGEQPNEEKPVRVLPPQRSTGVQMAKVSGGRPVRRKVVPPTPQPSPVPEKEVSLPGEESYLEAIASLSKAIEAGGDVALRPSLRTEYERNLAVVDQAIDATRRVARRNPKDQDATDLLFAAYQNKVDLLSAIADQTQMATLGR